MPALFLDRDDTLIPDRGYMSDPGQILLPSGVGEALLSARAAGFRLYLLTNQSGIGRGYYTMADAIACNARLEELIFGVGNKGFDGICIAPERPEEPSHYRKPSPNYILERITEDRLDKTRCFMIGDKVSDLGSGLAASINSILVARISTGAFRSDALTYARNNNLKSFQTIIEAVAHIIRVGTKS